MPENSEPLYSPRENDIFISYSPQNKFFAERLEKAIIQLGRDPWIDSQDLPPGMKLDKPEAWHHIEAGIKNADVFVFILSAASIHSKHNQAELHLAARFQKRLIPIPCEPIDSTDIPDVLQSDRTSWLLEPYGDRFPNFEEIARRVIQIQIHERLWLKALAWKEGGYLEDGLIYGTDLDSVKDWLKQTQRQALYLNLTGLQQKFVDESFKAEAKNIRPKQPDIFVSYSRRDRKFVEELCTALKQNNLNLWVDWENIPIAADWRQEIQEGIEKAHTFLFVISPDSVASPYCQDEIARALSNQKRTISVVWRSDYDRDLFNQVAALTEIKKYNWLYCESLEQLDEIVPQLIAAINTDLDYVKAHTRLLLQALEWKHQERREEFLLRKTELLAAQQLLDKGKAIEQQWLSQGGKSAHLMPIPLPTPLQEDFIAESARVEAEYERLERKRRFRLRILAGAVFFFLGLTGLAVLGQVQALNREIEALVSSLEGVQELDALVNGLQAGQQLQQWGWAIERLEPDLKVRVVTALQQQIYNLREQNRLVGHEAQIFNVSFSPDGELLASASEDGTVRVWQQQGKQVLILSAENGESQPKPSIINAIFNPGIDNETYTIAGATSSGTITLWTIQQTPGGTWEVVSTQDLMTAQASQYRIFSLSFSQGGQVLAAGGQVQTSSNIDGTVMLWRRDRQGEFQPLTTLIQKGASNDTNSNNTSNNNTSNAVLNVSFSRYGPYGERLAFADSQGKITVLTSQDLFNTTKSLVWNHESQVLSVTFSPDGQQLASAGENGVIKLWNLDAPETPPIALVGHEARVYRVSFSLDTKTIASASEDGSVRLWQPSGEPWSNGAQSKVLRGHLAPVYRVQFSPNGQTIATAGADDTIKLWSWDGTLIDSLEGHQDEVLSIEFASGGTTLASSSKDKTIRLWNVDNPVRVLPHTYRVYDLDFTPNGSIIASSGQDTVRLWRTQDGSPLINSPIEQNGTIGSISFVPHPSAITTEGFLLVTAGQNGTIKFWQLKRVDQGFEATEANVALEQPTVPDKRIYSISMSSTGPLLAASGANGHIFVWKLTYDASENQYRGTLLQTPKVHTGIVHSIQFSHNGRRLASAGQDGMIQLWAIEPANPGDRLIPTRQLQKHEGAVYSVSFSPDDQMLASASQDSTVRLWTLSGMLPSSDVLTGHSDEVLSVRFSPQGRLLASASRDDTVKLWTTSGSLITTLKGHRREVSSIAFSPDGKTLASASYDARALLWRLPTNFDLPEFIEDGCALAQDYLAAKQSPTVGAGGERNLGENALPELYSYCQKQLLRQEAHAPLDRGVR